ncbi:MAG: hypothetical protein P1V19_14460 [Gimesia sp.]|nr:hypothetical protein [Gimesia sp.]
MVINIEEYGASADLAQLPPLSNFKLSKARVIVAGTGETNRYITGTAIDKNGGEFHAICFLQDEAELKLKKVTKERQEIGETLMFSHVEPFDYIKGIGVTFLKCSYPESIE